MAFLEEFKKEESNEFLLCIRLNINEAFDEIEKLMKEFNDYQMKKIIDEKEERKEGHIDRWMYEEDDEDEIFIDGGM